MTENSVPLVDHRSEFQAALQAWFRQHQRPLPWRTSPSVYKTVVSEFMLQQTQVKTVLPYFDRWLRAFPDFASLAKASESQVLKHWEGLGYYSRARNLHRLAQAVAALPQLPDRPEGWLELPGVGPYTAAAISSIAFHVPVACVDGNVVRILSRLTADGTPFRDSGNAAKAYVGLANALVPAASPGDHNQAMMELGATVCTKQKPLCTVCPVWSFCRAGQAGNPEDYPRLAAKEKERVHVVRLWCEHEGSLLLHRAASSAKRLADLHELPSAGDLGLGPEQIQRAPVLAQKRRAITRFEITETILRWDLKYLPCGPETLPAGLHWVRWDRFAEITLSGPHRRWIAELSGRAL